MSIRLMLNGHNFSQACATVLAFEGQAAGTVPVVSFDTAKTVLLPQYLSEKEAWEDYLRFNGLAPTASETVVTSAARNGVVALMAVDERIAAFVGQRLGAETFYTSPLLEIASGARRDVNVFLTTDNAYLAVWEKGLRMAEVLPDPSAESLLYYLQVMGRRFKLKRFDINLSGVGADAAIALLAQYFRNVSLVKHCE